MGVTRRLKVLNPAIRCYSVQPDGPLHGLEGMKHMASAIVPGIYDRSVADVVAELVLTHFVGQYLPATAQVGVGRILGLLGERLARLSCLRAHPRRLSED